MKRPVDWSELQGLDPSLVSAIRDIYTCPAHFDGAFDDEEGASLTTAELLGDKKPAGEIEQAAAALWKWKQRRLSRGQSSTHQLAQQLAALPVTVPRRQRSIGEVFEEVVLTTPAVALSQLQRAVRASKASGSREDVELRMRERWALQLVCYIKESKLPCVERLAALGDSQATWLRIFGNRRGKTLRNRARSWKPVRDWLQITYGIPWASDAGQILKCLEERRAVAPLAKTVPRAILASISLLEVVGMVPAEQRLCEDQLLLESIRSWSVELETGKVPVKPAPMLPVAVLLACELVVCRPSYALGMRFTAFILLLMCWASLRADDVQNIDPSSVRLSQVGLRFVLSKTKTSGPGRKVGELHGFVSRVACLSGFDWILEGHKLLSAEALMWSRDFLCPAFTAEWDGVSKEFMEAEGLALQIRRLLQHLPTPVRQLGTWKVSRELLLPGQVSNFWTGHSARHVMTSLAAALGVGKDRRDYLGRWAYAQHGSQDYVLTSRQVVQGVQNFVCKCLLVGSPEGGYIEEELLFTMKTFAEGLGLESEPFIKACTVLKWDDAENTFKLGGVFPCIASAPDRIRASAGDLGAELPGPYIPFDREDDQDEAPYFITVSRRGFRRLHLSKSCAVRRENCLETIPVMKLAEGIADAVCKLCRPKMESGEASSTSGSEDVPDGGQAGPEEPGDRPPSDT